MNIEELFDVDENQLPILRPVARTLPIFRTIIEEDRGSKGDADGRKKHLAMKQIAYLYFSLSKRHFQNYGNESRDRAILRKLGLPDEFIPTFAMKVAYKELKEESETITEKILKTTTNLLHEHNDIFLAISNRNRAILKTVENMVLTLPDGSINQTAITTQKEALESLEANAIKVSKMVSLLPQQLDNVKQLTDKFVREIQDAKKANGVKKANKWEDD